MPSTALTTHLAQLLRDADELQDNHAELRTGSPGRQYRLAAINRAAVIMCVSAWEAYVEQLVRESIDAIRPPAPPLKQWTVLKASAWSQLGRFNTPNTQNVRLLFSDAIGLAEIDRFWTWRNSTAEEAVQRLEQAMKLRHEIAHGVNPRPVIHNRYSSRLPEFFRRLGRCTDDAVRNHLMDVLGVQNPWLA